MNISNVKFKIIEKTTKKWEKDFKEFYKNSISPRLIKNPSAVYFAAYFNDILVGHAALIKEQGKYILEGLRVRPEFREIGIGRKLTSMRIEYAAKNKAEALWYLARDGNLVSICCHMRFGFKKVAPKSGDSSVGDIVWYKLDLGN